MDNDIKLNDDQQSFLRKNTYLKPVYQLQNGDLIVLDAEIKDPWGNPVSYMLTRDCQVQAVGFYFAHIIPDWERAL